MKRWYKILLICLVMMGTVILGGCAKQAQLTSEMTVKEDRSGNRTIQIVLDKDLVRKGNDDPQDTLEQFMDQYCPKELKWRVKQQKEEYNLTLTLEFDTLEEYVEKAESLVGKQKIVYEDMSEGLRVGFSLKENVTAEDFLDWMKEALVKEKYIKKSDKEELFQLEKTYFIYDGKRQTFYDGKIQYETQKDYDVEEILILTQPALEQQWERVLYLFFPSELMEKNEAQIQEFLQSRISDGTDMEWVSQTCVRLTFSADSSDAMSEKMRLLFGQSTCKIEEKLEQNDVFSFEYQYKEYINTKDFAPKTGTIPVYYYVKNSEDGKLTYLSEKQNHNDELVVPELNNQTIQEEIKHTLESNEYHMVIGESIGETTVSYDMGCSYGVKSIDVSSVIRDSTSVSRSITVAYDRVPLESHKQGIQQDFETKTEQYGYTEILEKDGEYCVQVNQEGNWEELSDLFTTVFNGKDSASYKKDKMTLLTPSSNGYMEEKLDFSSFVPEGEEPQITYQIQFETGDVILKDTLDSTAQHQGKEETIKSNRYSATVNGTVFHITFTTQIKNLISMPLIALFVFIAAAGVIWYLHGERWKRIMENIRPTGQKWIQNMGTWWSAHGISFEKWCTLMKQKWNTLIHKIKNKIHRNDPY